MRTAASYFQPQCEHFSNLSFRFLHRSETQQQPPPPKPCTHTPGWGSPWSTWDGKRTTLFDRQPRSGRISILLRCLTVCSSLLDGRPGGGHERSSKVSISLMAPTLVVMQPSVTRVTGNRRPARSSAFAPVGEKGGGREEPENVGRGIADT